MRFKRRRFPMNCRHFKRELIELTAGIATANPFHSDATNLRGTDDNFKSQTNENASRPDFLWRVFVRWNPDPAGDDDPE